MDRDGFWELFKQTGDPRCWLMSRRGRAALLRAPKDAPAGGMPAVTAAGRRSAAP